MFRPLTSTSPGTWTIGANLTLSQRETVDRDRRLRQPARDG